MSACLDERSSFKESHAIGRGSGKIVAMLLWPVMLPMASALAQPDDSRIWAEPIMAQPFDTEPFRAVKIPAWVQQTTGCGYTLSVLRAPGLVEERYMASVLGAFRAAVEEHLPLAVINDWNLSAADLAPYKVLILANTACLDDAQVAAVDQFVRAGGGLVASLDTSLFDEFGTPRSGFALGPVLGVDYRGLTIPETTTGREDLDVNFARSIGPDYWEKRKDVFDYHQEPGSFLDQGRMHLYVGENNVTFKGPAVRVALHDRAAKEVGTLRSKTGDNPAARGVPAVVTRSHGKGKVIYLAAGFDAANYLYAFPYHRLILASAIRWAAAEPPPVEVQAPMCVHSTVMRQTKDNTSRLIVHLYSDLNTTAFHALPGDDVPLREEVVPIHDIRVNFSPRYKLRRVHLEPEGKDLEMRRSEQGTSIVVPRLEVHSMVVGEVE